MRNLLILFLAIAAGVLLLTGSCKHDPVDTPVPECDTLNVTFSGTVNPILQENCLACHNNANPTSGISLEGYSNVVTVAGSGLLMPVIRHDEAYPPMPQGGNKLSECKIAQIQKWIDNGTPNN
jgi:hypothetical protein